MTEKTVTEYPTGLSSIPYASFLQIERFSYEAAQKYAAQNFNDALGSLGRSAIARKVDEAVDGLATAYGSGSGDLSKNGVNLYQTQYKTVGKTKKTSRGSKTTGIRTVDIATADDSTEVKLKNGEITTIGKLKQKKKELQDRQNKGLLASKCMLPLPNEFQYKYGADWNNEFKLGTLALAADEAFRFAGIAGAGGVVGGLIQGGINKLTNSSDVSKKSSDKATKMVQSVVGGMKKAADPFKIGSELSPKNVAGLAGLAPNENSIQFFERMQGREFGFRFELASRNKTESNTVIQIIEWFKRGMHPGSKNGKGSAVMLTFPDVFVLKPMFVKTVETEDNDGRKKLEIADEPIQHPMMPKTKLCALTSLRVNTTPLGMLNTVFDGTIPLVTVELKFNETTALTRMDFEGSRTRSNNKLDKGFVASSEMANHPGIGF